MYNFELEKICSSDDFSKESKERLLNIILSEKYNFRKSKTDHGFLVFDVFGLCVIIETVTNFVHVSTEE